jgi:hypothetical protein
MRVIKKMDREELIKFLINNSKLLSQTDFCEHTTEELAIEKLKIQMKEEKTRRGRPRKEKE